MGAEADRSRASDFRFGSTVWAPLQTVLGSNEQLTRTKRTKGLMKKLMLALAVIGLLAGCASHENATGGTSDQYNSSSGQNNNSTKGTGTSMTTNINQNSTSP